MLTAASRISRSIPRTALGAWHVRSPAVANCSASAFEPAFWLGAGAAATALALVADDGSAAHGAVGLCEPHLSFPSAAATESASPTRHCGLQLRRGAVAQLHDRFRRLQDEYTVGELLGQGSFGEVRMGTHRVSGQRVAIKEMPKSATPARRFWAEITALDALSDEAPNEAPEAERRGEGGAEGCAPHDCSPRDRAPAGGSASADNRSGGCEGGGDGDTASGGGSGGHPAVASLLATFETPRDWIIVTQLAAGGELFERLVQRGAYGDRDAACAVRMLADGLAHVHACGIVHGDVKPENILLREPEGHGEDNDSDADDGDGDGERGDARKGAHKERDADGGDGGVLGGGRGCHEDVCGDVAQLAFVDFGNALPVSGDSADGVDTPSWALAGDAGGGGGSGTPGYTAPELIAFAHAEGAPTQSEDAPYNDGRPSTRSDAWALGVVMYIMLCACHPFDPDNEADDDEIERRILASEWEHDHPAISAAACDLLLQLLHRSPNERPEMDEVMNHEWLRSLDAASEAAVPEETTAVIGADAAVLDEPDTVLCANAKATAALVSSGVVTPAAADATVDPDAVVLIEIALPAEDGSAFVQPVSRTIAEDEDVKAELGIEAAVSGQCIEDVEDEEGEVRLRTPPTDNEACPQTQAALDTEAAVPGLILCVS